MRKLDMTMEAGVFEAARGESGVDSAWAVVRRMTRSAITGAEITARILRDGPGLEAANVAELEESRELYRGDVRRGGRELARRAVDLFAVGR